MPAAPPRLADMSTTQDITVDVGEDLVARVEIHRPPNNFLDAGLVADLADAYERLDGDEGCRAIVLCSEGKHFCAGAVLGDGAVGEGDRFAGMIYREACCAPRT